MRDIRAALEEGRFEKYYREMSPALRKMYGGVV